MTLKLFKKHMPSVMSTATFSLDPTGRTGKLSKKSPPGEVRELRSVHSMSIVARAAICVSFQVDAGICGKDAGAGVCV